MLVLKLLFVTHVLLLCIIEVRAFLRFDWERFAGEDSENKTRVGFINQWLDHFNPQDLRKWNMRYISNDEFFEAGGPIFIFLGGEWEIRGSSLTEGQIYELAKQHKGYMFYTEHRYYGKSIPTRDMSVENLKYLSVDQALADVVYFIQHIKEKIKGLRDSKVLVLGCSYSATMATWIRLKYPHIVDIAYASSGPVNAVADFYQYLEVVTRTIELASPMCLQIISTGIKQIDYKFSTVEGKLELARKFNMYLANIQEIRVKILGKIAYTFMNYVQHQGLRGTRNLCNVLEQNYGTPLDKLAFIVRYANKTDYLWREKNNDPHKITFPNDVRAWLYQTCTEFGWFQTTTSRRQPFEDIRPLDMRINRCSSHFGKEFNASTISEGIYRTNTFYGSNKPEVTKLISVHGTIDPWHPLGILNDLNPLAPVFLIEGASHCYDIMPNEISPELLTARAKIRNIIAEWLV